MVTKGGGEREEPGGRWSNVQNSSYKISTRDVMYNVMTFVNTAAQHIGKLLRE